MAHKLRQALDILELSSSLIGVTSSVTFDSGIYKHCSNENLNPQKDIFIIHATPEEPVTLENIIHVFRKMQKQFDMVEDYEWHRSYFYEGVKFDQKSQIFVIRWGS